MISSQTEPSGKHHCHSIRGIFHEATCCVWLSKHSVANSNRCPCNRLKTVRDAREPYDVFYSPMSCQAGGVSWLDQFNPTLSAAENCRPRGVFRCAGNILPS